MADAALLLDWFNRTDSLAAKLATPAPVEARKHDDWLRDRLARSDCMIWIIERTGRPIGQVRIERKGANFEVDVYVEPAERRASVASEAIRAALRMHAEQFPGAPVVARVRLDNRASQSLFAGLGFALADQKDDHLVYRRLRGGGASCRGAP